MNTMNPQLRRHEERSKSSLKAIAHREPPKREEHEMPAHHHELHPHGDGSYHTVKVNHSGGMGMEDQEPEVHHASFHDAVQHMAQDNGEEGESDPGEDEQELAHGQDDTAGATGQF